MLALASLPQVAAAQSVAPASTPAPTPTPSPATANDRPVRTYSGALTPYVGNIRTFQGDVDPLVGNIRTFQGDLGPYIGNIRTFSGSINPYVGNIRTFWGDLTPKSGDLDPMIGNIRTFSGEFSVSSQDILTLWSGLQGNTSTSGFDTLAQKLNAFVAASRVTWGAAVQKKTGLSFAEGFANPLLAKYGIDLAKPESLAGLDEYSRSMFFLEWYDNAVELSGLDHVDHWMNEINWSPAVTKTIGEGKRSIIGLLDFTVTGDGTQNITKYDGISTFTNGHGAAVASLMIAAHDGKGVMGIAPMASVVAYNPFDASGTAGWADVRNGVAMLAKNGASIVNMSLGVPGWTLNEGWNTVFSDPAVSAAAKGVVFVIAAGNDGSTQTQNIAWNKATNPNIVVVGSVDPSGKISSFSNQPGTACLVDTKTCASGDRLMDRFVVAPGELILVSDGQGGVTRASGTSFAAPLVSGTIALLHDRWPWLANYPKETVDIILQSSKDLGAPGTDPVYGRGELDVTAALSPLSFDNLKWYQYDKKGKIVEAQEKKIRDPKQQALWEAAGMFFYAYEDVGATFRDFAIPVSSKLVDQTAMASTGSMEYLQSYIYSRFMTWATATAAKGVPKFALANFSSAVPTSMGVGMQMAVAPRTFLAGYRQSTVPYQTAVRFNGLDDRLSFTVGEGDGAAVMGSQNGFGLSTDYDPYLGGANPLMGFASGGGYAQTSLNFGDHWNIAVGLTERTVKRDLDRLDYLDHYALGSIDPAQTGAQTFTIKYSANEAVSLNVSYTRLRETNALLGVQSLDPNDFADGSTTDGLSFGANAQITPTLSLTAAGTTSRTRANDQGGSFSIADGGLTSTSFQVALIKEKLIGRNDSVRLTVAQPMHLEGGGLDYTTVQVVNRQTGELGPVTQRFAITAPRRQFVGEMQYRWGGDSAIQMSLFGRAKLQGTATDMLPDLMAGAGFRLAM